MLTFFNKVVKLAVYLNNPVLVSGFQKYFGVDILSSSDNDTSKNASKFKKKIAFSEQTTFDATCGSSFSPQISKNFTQTSLHFQQCNYHVSKKFWYYLFSFGASLGYEYFYAIFFPFLFWNFDQTVARKITMFWVCLMYVGQSLKDLLKWPRPLSPPVVALEPEYAIEYGMPSTHAMIGAGIPFSLIIFTFTRFEYHIWCGIIFASVWCLLVCLSRLYLGMHSVLDILVGLLITAILIIIFVPVIEPLDKFFLINTFSPFILTIVILIMAVFYPKSNSRSPAKRDTCIVMGAGLGLYLGSWLTCHLGFAKKRFQTSLLPIIWLDFYSIVFVLLRTFIGVLILVISKVLAKSVIYSFFCYIYILKNERNRNNELIEILHKLFTYTFIGLTITYLSPCLFRHFNIEKVPLYIEF